MKAILFALGSRGDVEPFLAIGEILRKRNWEVICVFPEQFREMVEQEGYAFHGFSKEFLELMLKSETAHVITGGEGNFFQRVSSLIDLAKAGIRINKETHHGGSGTTHTALKHGCASLVVPHFIDQFYWNRVVAKVGAGPKGISIKKLEATRFETLLLDLLNNPSYKERAEWVATQMNSEVDEEKLLQLILQ